MKASLQLKYSQNLTMTPQLQQAIKLLQLSSMELQQEIQDMLDNNPMLDIEEATEGNEELDYHTDYKESSPNLKESGEHDDFEPGDDTIYPDSPDLAIIPAQDPVQDLPLDIAEELALDPSQNDLQGDNWEHSSSALGSSSNLSNEDDTGFDNLNASPETLNDYLLWQLNLCPISDQDKNIAYNIIESLDKNGYLSIDVYEIQESLNRDLERNNQPIIETDEILAVLHLVQQFEPPGIAAQNLQDCLRIQLQQLDTDTPLLREALLIIEKYLPLLASRDYAQIIRKTILGEDNLKQIIGLIQSLNPYPGESFNPSTTEYIIPDIIIKKHKGEWHAQLNDEAQPRLKVNEHYASFIKKADHSDDNNFLRNNLQEARWFIKSLQSRNETLLKVAREILKIQKGFFDYGPEAMKPLVLHDIAEIVGMHESTISRVTTQKYMLTPKGIFELKYFFSSHVGTDTGGECSSTAIRALIKRLVSSENHKKPLSDSRIADLLSEQGIQVARRTIAKYRESLAIPPSSERKRLI